MHCVWLTRLHSLAFCALIAVATLFRSDLASGGSVTDPYSDPRFVQWAQMYQAGNATEVAKAVEDDLTSPIPHPFAPHIWVVAHFALGDLSSALLATPRTVREKVSDNANLLA